MAPFRPALDAALGRARSVSGSILFVFVLSHLLNHALLLVSLDMAETGQAWFFALWRHPPGMLALYGAFVTHIGVALISLYRRRNWRLPAWQVAQIALGLTIPVLLIDHVVGTRIANAALGVSDTYARVLYVLWVAAPAAGITQAIVLCVAWVHGCIGLHFWLRVKAFYQPLGPWLFVLAVLVPAAALLGLVDGGREIERILADPARRDPFLDGMTRATAAEAEMLADWGATGLTIYAGLLGLVLVARSIGAVLLRHRGYARVTFRGAGGGRIDVPLGLTLLDASRSAGIPHASVCGGRGRCSTCRVRVESPEEGALAPAMPEERRVLDRVGAGLGVRLACQARIQGDVDVTPLLPPGVSARDARQRRGAASGREMQVAVLFADMRDFTRLAESRLPYDVVFILNRYFTALGHAIERAGGRIDKFIGDGVMALFGTDGDLGEGCRRALVAARLMGEELARLNAVLATELGRPLRIGVGIHAGPAIVGELGYGPAATLTAIGDTVNVASRLEALTKVYGCELVVSADAVAQTAVDLAGFPRHEIEVRGRDQPLTIHAVSRLEALPILNLEAPVPRGRRGRGARAGNPG